MIWISPQEPQKTQEFGRRCGRASSVLVWLVGALFAGCALLVVQAVQRGREAAIASGSQGSLNQLQLAFQNYHDTYGSFPPAYVADGAGNRIHSWRVLILPFVDAADLYEQYDFKEPWNGPNNSKLADRMPRIFHCGSEPDSSTFANFAVIVGPDTPFPGPRSTSLADFKDGPDNTILLVEVANARIPWLEPRDLDAATMSYAINDPSMPGPSTSRRNGPYVVFADYIHTYSLTESLHPEALRALTTVAGDEPQFMANVARGDFRGLVSLGDGPGTDADLAAFMDWPQVHDLWLNRSQITDAGLAELPKVPHLGKVHLAHTAVTDDVLKHFRGRTYLYLLNLSHTRISDAGLAHIRGLVEMPYLDVRGTHVTVPGIVKLLRSLPRTTIKFTGGEVDPQNLNLSNSTATDADLRKFRELATLDFVDLSHSRVTDEGLTSLSEMSRLRLLNLEGTEITDAGLVHLQGLSSLSQLTVRGTRVTPAGIEGLKRQIPALRVLEFRGTDP